MPNGAFAFPPGKIAAEGWMIGKRKAVRIPSELWTAIRENLEALGASSVEEYVEAVLREDLREKGLLPAYTPEEEREVERRLRDLGYLD